MVTALANAADQHLYLLRNISSGQPDGGHDDIFEADRSTAARTNEMNVIITVAPTGTIVLAQRVTYRIIQRWYAMDEPFLEEDLQGPVYRNPVEFFPRLFFDVAM